MTIEVISSEPTQAVTPAVESEVKPSAPEAKASEQNEVTESETETVEANEEAEESESNETETEEHDKPKKKGGFQRRIDKLNARVATKEQELEYWKQLALKGAGDSKPEKVESKPVAADGKPSPDNFETHAEYIEALTDWKTEQKLNERDQKAKTKEIESEQEKLVKSYVERREAFAKGTEDFNEVIESVDDIPLSAAIREIILTSENGPELAYELAKNREEYARVCKLPPIAAAREMGRLESKLAASKQEPKEIKKTTKAPAPIKPVGSKGGTVEKSIYDPSLSQAEYEALRAKQKKD